MNVGSALAYRSVPLQLILWRQAGHCVDSPIPLYEIFHDRLNIKISMVDLPAVNTPQFSWA